VRKGWVLVEPGYEYFGLRFVAEQSGIKLLQKRSRKRPSGLKAPEPQEVFIRARFAGKLITIRGKLFYTINKYYRGNLRR